MYILYQTGISIHAPSRERRQLSTPILCEHQFQSTLPHGSDWLWLSKICLMLNFNPRSLTGATLMRPFLKQKTKISIHAPSRERLRQYEIAFQTMLFQSTLPHGSDIAFKATFSCFKISIHAPSRERPVAVLVASVRVGFQSTLPHGSDLRRPGRVDFQPPISIHAPSRERPN